MTDGGNVVVLRLIGLASGLMLCVSMAAAQSGRLPINDPGDVLQRDPANSIRWTVRTEIEYTPGGVRSTSGSTGPIRRTGSNLIIAEGFRFSHAFIGETASSVPYQNESRMRVLYSESVPKHLRFTVPDRRTPVATHWRTNLFEAIETGDHLDRQGVIELDYVQTRRLTLIAELDVRSWATMIDEEAADLIEWPQGEFPPGVERYRGRLPVTALPAQAQQGVTHRSPGLTEQLDIWLEGRDPRDVRPYALAKHLAYCVLIANNDEALFDEDGRRIESTNRVPRLVRVETEGVLTSRLLAVYREAGIPARIVIAHDERARALDLLVDTVDEELEQNLGLEEEAARQDVLNTKPWIEFALYDESRGVTEWIPVDIEAQRAWSSRIPSVREPWRYFGNHPELHRYAPFAFSNRSRTGFGIRSTYGWWDVSADAYHSRPGHARVTMTSSESPRRAGDPVDPFSR